ncbi:hypothetical protein CAEBREN_25423 [Caenorhabditis brenneri]|uniref:Uncharacterized protein n=1 Tax=Caenorhabditis brenneri TaxID=135651 RepID=G0MW84_CAEBE|nr:hypothetical protein CAEBREN_25423 [Caenorhabditis brenneri]
MVKGHKTNNHDSESGATELSRSP